MKNFPRWGNFFRVFRGGNPGPFPNLSGPARAYFLTAPEPLEPLEPRFVSCVAEEEVEPTEEDDPDDEDEEPLNPPKAEFIAPEEDKPVIPEELILGELNPDVRSAEERLSLGQ
jgi:hypothetical protein